MTKKKVHLNGRRDWVVTLESPVSWREVRLVSEIVGPLPIYKYSKMVVLSCTISFKVWCFPPRKTPPSQKTDHDLFKTPHSWSTFLPSSVKPFSFWQTHFQLTFLLSHTNNNLMSDKIPETIKIRKTEIQGEEFVT